MNLPSLLLGTGILCWNASERRSDRYGAFYLADATYSGERSKVRPTRVDKPTVDGLVGQRIRLVAKSVEARKSRHVGDLFHNIYPDPLAVGTTIEIGVGILRTGETESKETTFELHPEDGRSLFWIDPRILFQLHDQTIELYGEESTAPAHAPFVGKTTAPDSAIGVDSSTLQYKGTRDNIDGYSLSPTIERLGGGLFSVTMPTVEAGKRIKLQRR